MARRIISVLIILCIISTLTACKKKESFVEPVNFYYLSPTIEYHHPEGMIKSERREILNEGDDLAKIMNLYLRGPQDVEFITPFPDDVTVISITQSNGIVRIVVSDQFAVLTGYELNVACACITMTLQELVDTQLIQISAETELLDGSPRITMNKDSLIIYDQPDTNEK